MEALNILLTIIIFIFVYFLGMVGTMLAIEDKFPDLYKIICERLKEESK